MTVKVVCAILVFLPAVVICARRGESCTTPNGEVAKCTAISGCKIIKDAIESRKREAIEFARASQCGYDTEPLVCCGTTAVKSARGSPCKTPNGEATTCKPLRGCKVIFDAVLSRDKDAIEFAKNSQCGYDSEPLVCCGSTGYPSLNTGPSSIPNAGSSSLSPWLPDRDHCGVAKSFRVYGGELTQIGEHPWVVLLRYKHSDGTDAGFQCGGTLINNRYVLTAAHCVVIGSNQGFELDSVRLGEWRISSARDCEEGLVNEECADPVIDLTIEQKIVNQRYERRSGRNDIALLRLERNVKYSDYVRPICLPDPDSPIPAANTKLVVVGWGATENSSTSDDKLKVQVPIVSLRDCAAKLKNQRRQITEDQLCAGGASGKDSCRGDSGGPLMGSFGKRTGGEQEQDQFYQAGVVSWGVGCGIAGYPAIYTRVSRYMNWINENLKAF